MTEWIPMEPQPERVTTLPVVLLSQTIPPVEENGFVYCNEKSEQIIPPHAIGDLIAEREEWRIWRDSKSYWVMYRDGIKAELTIDNCPSYDSIHKAHQMSRGVWQPASTMPDFAVRKWAKVTGIEAKRAWDVLGIITEEQPNTWGWLITTEKTNA